MPNIGIILLHKLLKGYAATVIALWGWYWSFHWNPRHILSLECSHEVWDDHLQGPPPSLLKSHSVTVTLGLSRLLLFDTKTCGHLAYVHMLQVISINS